MSEASKKQYGFILFDADSKIKEVYASASYEDTLDGKLAAVNNDWTYVPMSLVTLVDELSKVDIYESDGSRYCYNKEG